MIGQDQSNCPSSFTCRQGHSMRDSKTMGGCSCCYSTQCCTTRKRRCMGDVDWVSGLRCGGSCGSGCLALGVAAVWAVGLSSVTVVRAVFIINAMEDGVFLTEGDEWYGGCLRCGLGSGSSRCRRGSGSGCLAIFVAAVWAVGFSGVAVVRAVFIINAVEDGVFLTEGDEWHGGCLRCGLGGGSSRCRRGSGSGCLAIFVAAVWAVRLSSVAVVRAVFIINAMEDGVF